MQVAMASEERTGLDFSMLAPGTKIDTGTKIDHERLKAILSREGIPEMCLENPQDMEKKKKIMALDDTDLDEQITKYTGLAKGNGLDAQPKDKGQKLESRVQLLMEEKERRRNCPKSGETVTIAGSPRFSSQETSLSNSSNRNISTSVERPGHRGQQSDRKLSAQEAGPSWQQSLPSANGLEGRTSSGQQAGPSGQQSRTNANWPQLSICRRSSMVLRSSSTKEASRFFTRQSSHLGASPVVDTVRKGKSVVDSPGIGQSKDTAMELFSSDDEGSERVLVSPRTKTPVVGRSRRPGLRPSITCSLEQRTIAYPSRDDPDAIEVPSSDLQRLAPLEFLNDTIIDFYIKYIQCQGDGKDSDRFHFFNSFFYKKLSDIVHQKAKRGESKESKENKEKEILKMQKWTKGTDIFDKAYLFVPVHDNLHWSLAIICLPPSPGSSSEYDPCIYHLDSMQPGHNSTAIFKALRMYLVAEWKQRFEQEGNRSDSSLSKKLKTSADIFQARRIPVPQQENESDCGLFLLHYIERFIQDSPPNLRWGDSPHDKLFGRKWFDPQEASSLRDTIRAILESLFEAEAKAGSVVSRPGNEGLFPETEGLRCSVTADAKKSMPEAKEKFSSEDDVQLVVDLAGSETGMSGPESAPTTLCSQDSVVQSSKGCVGAIPSSSECVTPSPEDVEK